MRIVKNFSIEQVRILAPESNYSATYTKLVPRIEIETVVYAATAQLGIDCRRISRRAARSSYNLPQSGRLSDLVNKNIERVGPYWNDKRSLAALVAICGNRET